MPSLPVSSGELDKGSFPRSVEYWCAVSAPIGLVTLISGLVLVARLIPVWDPNSSADEIAANYRERTVAIRAGLFIALLGMGMYAPITVVISRRLRRIEPRQKAMEYLQLVGGTAGWVFLLLPLLMWSAVAYRPERAPEITQMVHDVAWFTMVMDLTPFIVQYIAICVCIFNDKSNPPIFPRWIGYLNIWVVLLFIPTGIITFFHTGPFTYGGLIGFYIPLTIFSIWLCAMPWAICRDIKREEHEITAEEY